MHHHDAIAWLDANAGPLLTTDYVIDETLTLLRARGHPARAIEFGRLMFEEDWATIHFVDERDIRAAWEVFLRFDDKAWSFTDCISKVVMGRVGITQAFAFDHHFRQFGTVVVP